MTGNKTMDPELQDTLAGIWDSLTEAQKEKAKACESPAQLMKLAAEEGVELPDEMLDAVAGGYLYRTYQDSFNPRKDRYEVIRDSDGEILARDLSLQSAEKRAAAERQSVSVISADYLEYIKGKGKSGC